MNMKQVNQELPHVYKLISSLWPLLMSKSDKKFEITYINLTDVPVW
jgi:hypothetical protein